MKYYKKINNEFLGFYDSEINENQLFDTTYEDKTIVVEKQNNIADENIPMTLDVQYEEKTITVPVKTLKDGFYEISDERWMGLLNGQSEGKEIRILKDGNLGLFILPQCNIEGGNVVFDYEKEQWVDTGTSEERQSFWKKKMIEVNNQIKELSEIGLSGGTEETNLRLKLEKYRTEYFNALHEEAIIMDMLRGEPRDVR